MGLGGSKIETRDELARPEAPQVQSRWVLLRPLPNCPGAGAWWAPADAIWGVSGNWGPGVDTYDVSLISETLILRK